MADNQTCVIVEIDAQIHSTLLEFTENPSTLSEVAYFWDDDGSFNPGTDDISTFSQTPAINWLPATGAPPPSHLIMEDTAGDPMYVYTNYGNPPIILATASEPGSRGLYIGPYLDWLDIAGDEIHRMTVNPDTSFLMSPLVQTPERKEPIRIQNGHPFAFDGNLYYSDLIALSNVEIEVPIIDGRYGGVAQASFSELTISLRNQRLDFLTKQHWEGRGFTVKRGLITAPLASYTTIVSGVFSRAEWTQDDITFHVRDKSLYFDRPLQPNRYAGTGGYEGTAELEGRLKPLCYGNGGKVEPVLIEPNLNLYQYHDGPALQVQDVYHGGVFLTLQSLGDLPDGLLTWSPTQLEIREGNFYTDIARGLIRFAGPLEKRVLLIDMVGQDDIPGMDGTTLYLSDLIKYVLTQRLPEITIDTTAFTNFRDENLISSISGIYETEDIDTRDLFNSLLNTHSSCLAIDASDNAYIVRLQNKLPVSTWGTVISPSDIIEDSLQRIPPPSQPTSYSVGYARVHGGKYTENDLFGLAFDPIGYGTQLMSDYQYLQIDPNIPEFTRAHPFGKQASLVFNDTRFSAQALPNGELLSQKDHGFRDVYGMTVKNHTWQFRLGDTVQWTYPRWGLDVPRTGVIVYIKERSPTGGQDNLTDIRIWC